MTAHPFHRCDDVHDAAAQAVEAIEGRLAPRGLQLTGPDALRDLLAAALQLADVVEADNPEAVTHGVTDDASAAIYLDREPSELRAAVALHGPGAMVSGKDGRSATFLGTHPNPSIDGWFWWRITEKGYLSKDWWRATGSVRAGGWDAAQLSEALERVDGLMAGPPRIRSTPIPMKRQNRPRQTAQGFGLGVA